MTPRAGAPLAVLVLAGSCVAPSTPIAPAPAPLPQTAATPAPAPPPISGEFVIAGAIEQGGWVRGKAPSNTLTLTLGEVAVPVGPDGSFFAGFDRDAPASVDLLASDGRGGRIVRTLRVAPRAWSIERIDVPLRGSVPSETFMERRRPELARIAAAREARSDSMGWKQTFIWPVKGRISGRFGSQRIYRGVPGSYHSGLDIAPGNGIPFVAPADGVVVLAAQQPFSLEGNLVIIDHGMGLNSAFLHASRLAVRAGEVVRQGQLLGNVGATGRASGPHLHWSLMWQSARLDPLLVLPPQ